MSALASLWIPLWVAGVTYLLGILTVLVAWLALVAYQFRPFWKRRRRA